MLLAPYLEGLFGSLFELSSGFHVHVTLIKPSSSIFVIRSELCVLPLLLLLLIHVFTQDSQDSRTHRPPSQLLSRSDFVPSHILKSNKHKNLSRVNTLSVTTDGFITDILTRRFRHRRTEEATFPWDVLKKASWSESKQGSKPGCLSLPPPDQSMLGVLRAH